MKPSDFLLLSAILIAGLSISCNKDDEEKENKANIIGTWIADSRTVSGCENEDNNFSEELQCTENNCITYTFRTDSTGAQFYTIETVSEGILTGDAGTFEIGETRLSLCVNNEGEVECTSARIELTSDTMVLTFSGQADGCSERLSFMKLEEEEEG